MAEMMDSSPSQVNDVDQKGKKSSRVFWLLWACLIGAGLSFGYWWFFMRNRVATDNAYVVADNAAVSSRVAGSISAIMVENDDEVMAGAVLVQLDPRDFQAEVDKQRAALVRIQAEIEMAEVNISLTDSQTSAQLAAAEAAVLGTQDRERELRHHLEELERNRVAAEAEFSHAKKDFERYSNLLKEGAGSEQQRDRTNTAFKKSKAQYEATAAQIAAAKASLAGAFQEIDRVKAQRDAAKANRLRVDMEKKNLAALKARLKETQAQLDTAELNLSYCTITAPVAGITGAAAQADGTYLNQQNAQLTTVAVLSPMYVNFSLSENEFQGFRDQIAKGQLERAPDNSYVVEIVLVDGQVFPHTGRVTFADPAYSAQTGTFLIRATVDNPQGLLKPNQYVRVRVKGATRPNAILLPQRAVLQGARGHFVWVVDKDGKAENRPVTVGDWSGDEWLVIEGLRAGEKVVVDGGLKLGPGAALNPKPYVAGSAPSQPVAPKPATAAPRTAAPATK